MRTGNRKSRLRDSRPARLGLAAAVLAATGILTVTFVSSGGKGTADAATSLSEFVPIEQVAPNVEEPQRGRNASVGKFTVDCGTNGNGKFSSDNPVAQPGIRNGAEHVHDFVGNLAINADSSNEELEASDTTCKNGDKSSYFWPVVRIDRSVRADSNALQQALASTSPTVICPSVRSRMPAVPADVRGKVDRLLSALDRLEVEAGRKVLSTRGVNAQLNNSVLNPLRDQRMTILNRINQTLRAGGGRQASGMVSMAECAVSYDSVHAAVHGKHNSAGNATAKSAGTKAGSAETPTVRCPNVRDKLPGVPQQALAEVDNNLAQLDRQISEANQRLVSTRGQGGPNFIDNAILGPLKAKRAATLDRIGIAMGRQGERPQGLEQLAGCTLNNEQGGNEQGGNEQGGNEQGGNEQGGNEQGGNEPPAELPAPEGPNFELPGNPGEIVRPAEVRIEYRGNANSKVVAQPKFLRQLTGESKPTARGPANARNTWTCSGFGDRLSDKYPICPEGSLVQRVHDFPGCWDGKNIDSANHRDHVAFADKRTDACPEGFVAIPQLRITISYDIPRDVQLKGQFALDSFPEENHNPFSDHNDFINVNSDQTMQRIANCINKGKRCA